MNCWSGGDPHTIDFFNAKYDQHWEGTYYLIKYDNFIVQSTIKICRPRQGWSAGRTIGCQYEFGVQLAPGQVLRVAGNWGGNKRTRRNPTLNGNNFLNQRKSFNGGVTAHCGGNACTIEHPDMRVLLRNSPPYNDYTITMKKRGGKFVAVGRAFGTCGGLGRQQYGGNVRGSNGGHSRYPCKTCTPGGAYKTVMCRCQEFGVPQNKALVASWQSVAKSPVTSKLADAEGWPKMTMLDGHGDAHSGAVGDHGDEKMGALGADTEKCLNAFQHMTRSPSDHTLLMKDVFDHCPGEHGHVNTAAATCKGHIKSLAKLVEELADSCGGDDAAAHGRRLLEFNSKEFKEFEEFEKFEKFEKFQKMQKKMAQMGLKPGGSVQDESAPAAAHTLQHADSTNANSEPTPALKSKIARVSQLIPTKLNAAVAATAKLSDSQESDASFQIRFEKTFCSITQQEAATNPCFAKEFCKDIVTPCRTEKFKTEMETEMTNDPCENIGQCDHAVQNADGGGGDGGDGGGHGGHGGGGGHGH